MLPTVFRANIQTAVYADVVATGYDSACVYEQSLKEFDNKTIAEIANKLFDNGEYELVRPYEISTIDELHKEKEYLEGLAAEYNIIDISSEQGFDKPYILTLIDAVDFYIDNYDDSKAAEGPDGELITHVSGRYYANTGTDGAETIEDEGRDECTLRGYVDGEVWMLYYLKPDNNAMGDELKIFALTQNTVKSFNAILTSNSDINSIKYGENRCDYTQAERDAEAMLEKIGFEDMAVVHSSQVIVPSSDELDYMDGYGIVFASDAGSIRLGYSSLMVALSGTSDLGFAEQSYISVHVNSSGIQCISITKLYDLGEKLSDGVELLEFEQIDKIAQEQLQNIIKSIDEADRDTAYNETVGRIELNYVTVSYDGKMYSLVPAWLYYYDNDYEDIADTWAAVCINALDGSVIGVGASSASDASVLLSY